MNVFAKRALILTVLVLCLFGITILGASAAATGNTTANAETDVASFAVEGTTYYYESLDTAIAEAVENGAGTVNVLKSTELTATKLADKSLKLVGATDGITITRSGSLKYAFWLEGATASLTLENLTFDNYAGCNVFYAGIQNGAEDAATGEFALTLNDVTVNFSSSGAIYFYACAKFDVTITDSSFVASSGNAILNAGGTPTPTFAAVTMHLDGVEMSEGVKETNTQIATITRPEVDTGYANDAEAIADGMTVRTSETEGGTAYYKTLTDAINAGAETVYLITDFHLGASLSLTNKTLKLVGATDDITVTVTSKQSFWLKGDASSLTFENLKMDLPSINLVKVSEDKATANGSHTVNFTDCDVEFAAGGLVYCYNLVHLDLNIKGSSFASNRVAEGVAAGLDGLVSTGGTNKPTAATYTITIETSTLTTVVPFNPAGVGTPTVIYKSSPFATDADAISAGLTIRLGATVGGKAGEVYFATLNDAINAIPAGGTAEIYIIAPTVNGSTPVINNKFITVIGPDSSVNDGKYDITHVGSSYIFNLDHKGSITLKNLAIKTSHAVLGYGYATTVTESGIMAFKLENTNVASTYAHFVYSHGSHGNKTYPIKQFDIIIDENSTVTQTCATTSTVAPFYLNKAYFTKINITIDGKISYTATSTLKQFYFIYVNNPPTYTTISKNAEITLNIPTPSEACSFIYSSGAANALTLHLDAITDDNGVSTLEASGLPMHYGNGKATLTITGGTLKSDELAISYGAYFRIGEEGSSSAQYFSTLNAALAAVPANPASLDNRELTTIYLLKDGYSVGGDGALKVDNKSVFITSAGSTALSIKFTGNNPVQLYNSAWLRLGNITLIATRRFMRFESNADGHIIFEMENGATVHGQTASNGDGNFIFGPFASGKVTVNIKQGATIIRDDYPADRADTIALIFNLNFTTLDPGSSFTIAGKIINNITFDTEAKNFSMFRCEDPDVTLTIKPTAQFITATTGAPVNSSFGAMIAHAGPIIIEAGGSASEPQFKSVGANVPPILAPQWATTTITIKGTPVVSLGTAASGQYSAFFTNLPPDITTLKFTSDAAAVEWLGAIARVGEIPAEGGSLGTTYFKTLEEAAAATKDGKVYLIKAQTVTSDTTFTGVDNITLVNATGGALFNVSGTANLTIDNATIETSTALINIGATTGTVTIGENAKIYLVGTPASTTYLINITGALNGKLDVKGDLYLGKSSTEIVTGNGEMGFVNHNSASENGVIDISGDLYAYAKTATGTRNGFIYIKAALKELNVSGSVTASIEAGDQVKFIWANAAVANGINFSATANYTVTSGTISQFIFAQGATAPVNLNGANITYTANTVNGAYSSIVFTKSPVTIVGSTLKVTGTASNGFPILHNYDLDNVTFTLEDSTFINETTGKYAQLVAAQAQSNFTTLLAFKGEIVLNFTETSAKAFDVKKNSCLEVTGFEKLTLNNVETDVKAFATTQGLPIAYAKNVDNVLRTYYYAQIPAEATHKVVTTDETFYFGDLATACKKLVELKVDNTSVLTMEDVPVVTYKPAEAVDSVFTVDNAFFVDDLALAIELASDGSVIVVNKNYTTESRSLVIANKSITITGATAGISITNTVVDPHFQMFYVANGGELTITNLTIVTEGRGIAVGSTDASAPAKFTLGAGATLTGPSGRNSMVASGNLSDSTSMLYGEIVIAEGATISRTNELNSETSFWGNGVIMCFYQNFTGSVEIAGTISVPDLVATGTDPLMIQIYNGSVITIDITGSITYSGTGTEGKLANLIYVGSIDTNQETGAITYNTGNSVVALHIAESATITNTWTGATSNVINQTFTVGVEINGKLFKTATLANAIALAPAGTLENPTVIKLLQDISVMPKFYIEGKHILITSEGTTRYKITRTSATSDFLFILQPGASLAFENVEVQVDGRIVCVLANTEATKSYVRVGNNAWLHASATNSSMNALLYVESGNVYTDIIIEKGAKVGYDEFTAQRETQVIFVYGTMYGDITINGEVYIKVNSTSTDKNTLVQISFPINGTVTFGADSVVTMNVNSLKVNAVVWTASGAAISGGIHLYGEMNVTYTSTTNAEAQAVLYVQSAAEVFVYDGAEITLTSSATAAHSQASIIYTWSSVTMTGGTLKYAGTFTPGNVIYADNGGAYVNISGNARLISEGVTPNLLQGFSYNTLILTRQPATKVSITGNVYLECHSTSNAISLNNHNTTHGASTVVVDGATINFPNANKICPDASTYRNLKFSSEADAVRMGFALRVGEGYFNSVAAAVAAAPAGATIYLVGDITVNETAITLGQSVTFASTSGNKFKLTFPKQYSGWTASTRPFAAAIGTTITFKDIEVYVEGGRLISFATTASASETITFNMVNAFIHGGSIGNNGNAMLSMGGGTDTIYVNINIDAQSKIGYDPAPEGSVDYVATRTLQVIMAYGVYAGTMNIAGEIYQDIWSEDVNFDIGWTNGGFENQSILEIHNFSGTINITGKMYQKVIYPEEALTTYANQGHVAVVIDVKAITGTPTLNIDWSTASLVTDYTNADPASGLYKGAGMQGATEVLDAEGNVIYTRFVGLFRDTFKVALKALQVQFPNYRNFRVFHTCNHSAGYSGNIGGMTIDGDIEVLWTGDNPYTAKKEQFVSTSSGYDQDKRAGGTMLMEISGGADLTLENVIILRNGRVFSFRANPDPENPANLILGEGAILRYNKNYRASNNVWISAGVNDDQKTEIYANFIMLEGSMIDLTDCWYDRDLTVIFSTSIFVGDIVLGGEIVMDFTSTINHRLIASYGKTSYRGKIVFEGDFLYNMDFTVPTLSVSPIDVTGPCEIVFKDGANIVFNPSGCDLTQSALVKTSTAASSNFSLAIEGGIIDIRAGYGFWLNIPTDVNYAVYNGYIQSQQYAAFMLRDGATLNVYGGILAYTGKLNGVAPVALVKGTMNVNGGVFKTTSTVAPALVNDSVTSAMNLNSFMAVSPTSVVSNLGSGYPTMLAHNKYDRTVINMMQAQIGARPVFTDNADLGFMATISADLYNQIKSVADRSLEPGSDGIDFGMLYIKASDLPEGVIFTHSGLNYANIDSAIEILEGDINFTVSGEGNLELRGMFEVPAAEYATRYSVVFFAKYYINGHVTYAYTAFDPSENTRSLEQVARAAYNDTKTSQNSIYQYETGDSTGIWSPYSVENRAKLADWYGDGSTDVELKNLDLYLLAGGSNAAGFTAYSNSFYKDMAPQISSNILYSGLIQTTLKQSIGGTVMNVPYTKYVPGSSALTFNRGWGENAMGSEVGMAIALSKQYTDNNYAAILKFADLDSTIEEWNEELVAKFIEMIENEVSLYKRQGYNVTVKGMFWQQGEADLAAVDSYSASFNTLVSALRARDCMEDLIVNVGTLSMYDANTGKLIANNEAFVEMQMALANAENDILVNDATIMPTANGLIVDPMDVNLNGQVAVTEIMKAAGLAPEYAPEIAPVATITVTVEGQPVEVEYRSLIVAIANLAEGQKITLVDDLTLYTPLVLNKTNAAVIDGAGKTLTLKPDAGAGIVVSHTSVEFQNLNIVQTGTADDSYVFQGTKKSNITLSGTSTITANDTVAMLSGSDSKFTVQDDVTLANTADNADDALIVTSGSHVLVKGNAALNAKGTSACIMIDESALYKTSVVVESGTFTTENTTTTFVNHALETIMVIANAVAEAQGITIMNNGFGTNGAYNDLMQ